MKTGHILLTTLLLTTIAARTSVHADDQYHLDWSVQYGGKFDDTAEAVAVGRFGNIYAAGHGKVDQEGLNPMVQTITSAGQLSWSDTIGEPGNDLFLDVTTDNRGSVFVVGRKSKRSREGLTETILTKYYALNLHCWSRSLIATEYVSADAVTVDSCGSVFICGAARGKLNGKPAPNGEAAYVAKYDTFGRLCWLEFVQFPVRAAGQTIAVAQDGSIYVGGYSNSRAYIAALDYNGKTLKTAPIQLIEDVKRGNFRVRIHPEGQLICGGSSTRGRNVDGYLVGVNRDNLSVEWDVPFRTDARDYVIDFAIDSCGVIHVAGNTSGTLGKSLGRSDGFLARVSSSGKLIGKVFQFGTKQEDTVRGIALDHCDRLIIGGRTRGTFPNSKRPAATKSDGVEPFNDAFVARFRSR